MIACDNLSNRRKNLLERVDQIVERLFFGEVHFASDAVACGVDARTRYAEGNRYVVGVAADADKHIESFVAGCQALTA